MISQETGLPDSFDLGYRSALSGEPDMATTKNVKWVARLGRETHGTPVIAGGKVLVGTNNERPRGERMRELKVINRISLPDPILSSPAAAKGTLYVATFRELYAFW